MNTQTANSSFVKNGNKQLRFKIILKFELGASIKHLY